MNDPKNGFDQDNGGLKKAVNLRARMRLNASLPAGAGESMKFREVPERGKEVAIPKEGQPGPAGRESALCGTCG